MRLLVSGATTTMRQLCEAPSNTPHLGHLYTPRDGNDPYGALHNCVPFACDNAAFSDFDPDAYRRMLDKMVAFREKTGAAPMWVTAPDVVGDAYATFESWIRWDKELAATGLPVALVAQDGIDRYLDAIPWHAIRCVFIGGTDDFKLGYVAQSVIAAAQHRMKLVHVGRVNSVQRITRFYKLGVDSIDGSSASMFPETKIPIYLRAIKDLHAQSPLPLGGAT